MSDEAQVYAPYNLKLVSTFSHFHIPFPRIVNIYYAYSCAKHKKSGHNNCVYGLVVVNVFYNGSAYYAIYQLGQGNKEIKYAHVNTHLPAGIEPDKIT